MDSDCFPDLNSDDLFPFINEFNAGGQQYENQSFKLEEVEQSGAIDPPTGVFPSLSDFDGPFKFSLVLKDSNANKSWLYSSILNSIFIKMNNVLMMDFKVDRPHGDMFVRALLVYVNSDFANEPVKRCCLHSMEDDLKHQAHPQGESHLCYCSSFNNAGHVIQSQSTDAVYCFDSRSGRHSVLVPLPPPEPDSNLVSLPFIFTCKSSCPYGMQRRPVQIIFTLEDSRFNVHGRKVVPVKICSCPKRDKTKQEDDSGRENCRKRKSAGKTHESTGKTDEPPVKKEITEKQVADAIAAAKRVTATKKSKLLESLHNLKDSLHGVMECVLEAIEAASEME